MTDRAELCKRLDGAADYRDRCGLPVTAEIYREVAAALREDGARIDDLLRERERLHADMLAAGTLASKRIAELEDKLAGEYERHRKTARGRDDLAAKLAEALGRIAEARKLIARAKGEG